MVRTAHFTTKIEQNKLELNEVEELYLAYKKTSKPTYKVKSRIEIRNVFDAYSHNPPGYRQTLVYLKDDSGEVSYTPPPFTEVGTYMGAFFK